MGCRTRVIGNVYDPTSEICNGRGNLSFTSINLPRLAIKAKGDIERLLRGSGPQDRPASSTSSSSALRYRPTRRVRNYPFLMGQGVWLDSEKLGVERRGARGAQARHAVRSALSAWPRRSSALIGEHHGESESAQNLGLEIIGHMRQRMDEESQKTGLNYHAAGHARRGPVRSLCARWTAQRYRRDSRRDRPRILHEQLPHPGLLPDLAPSRRSGSRRPTTR